jgi:hypothetical protein
VYALSFLRHAIGIFACLAFVETSATVMSWFRWSIGNSSSRRWSYCHYRVILFCITFWECMMTVVIMYKMLQ